MSRIYIVDDHTIVRDGLRAMLESGQHQVVGESAEPTQAMADLNRLEPDVVLLDLDLGGRSGHELLSDLQRRALPVRVLVLTMSVKPRDVAEAIRLGAKGYLLKDCSRQELLGAVDSVMRGQRYLGPEVAELAVQAFTDTGKSDPLAELSPRERQIISLVVLGQTSQAIGERLHLSPKTVDSYRSRLMAKLGVADITGLVRFAIRAGLIDAETR